MKTIKGVGAMAAMGVLPMSNLACQSQGRKLGVALVGMGSYSTYQLAPALQDTQHCYLAGVVTGTPAKEKEWADKYGIPSANIYNYENFDAIADNKDIDVVYVVLPNAMHAEFCIRAAKAGKHVICEKPMAISVKECDDIINACNEAGVKLGVGYRLQSEPYTNEIKRIVREKPFGEVRYVSAEAGYRSRSNPDQWRLDKALAGGGALLNMGVYAIQGAIYGTGQNPISVSAQEFSTDPEYFKDTDESISAQFKFPNGATGNIFTSHSANVNRHYSAFDNGWLELNPANNYGPLSGRLSTGEEIKFPHESQQKLQMDDFALHVLENAPNKAPGEMGKRDMIICEAIYQSIAEGGRTIDLDLGRMGIVD
ncbi:Gfo/Idh/MocA family oxidoreductase [Roseivirga sp.]|jgi:glucose-fructose oxidoreductase|uniref:Gfo/Idh/MocA family protein n=1 Tax=Roseivirga sp. TaxID=1964215 RepID=UPI002354C921|nr:Gfo/Idh/MocA family oxidoreductase [Roseivirga sp.]